MEKELIKIIVQIVLLIAIAIVGILVELTNNNTLSSVSEGICIVLITYCVVLVVCDHIYGTN